MITKFIEGEKVYLRPYENEKDLELFYFGKNHPEVRKTFFFNEPFTKLQTEEEMNKWISSKDTILFTICENETNIPIGLTGLTRIDMVSRSSVYFIVIYNHEYWSKGYGGESTQLVLRYCFDILNLNRIQLHVSKENEKGVKAYKRAGFEIEGTLREAMYHNNEYVDFYVMGLLRRDYYKK